MFLLMLSCAQRMRSVRNRFGLQNLVQIHHIIPKEHSHYRSLERVGFDADCCENLIFMPAAEGLDTKRFVHNGGHAQYNRYVFQELERGADPRQLVKTLRQMLRNADPSLPWANDDAAGPEA